MENEATEKSKRGEMILIDRSPLRFRSSNYRGTRDDAFFIIISMRERTYEEQTFKRVLMWRRTSMRIRSIFLTVKRLHHFPVYEFL